MRLLLDTVTFIWAYDAPVRLSGPAMSALANPKAAREISALSFSEIAIKQALGKLKFLKRDVLDAAADLQLRVLPYTAEHALQLFDLPLHHRDPFDRLIIAQAHAEEIPVVTSDRDFRLYRDLKVIW